MATSISKLLIRLTKFSSKTSKVIDATSAFNVRGTYYQDLSGWDTAVVQFVTPSEAITFFTTNDDNAVTGQLLPSPEVPVNWTAVEGINLATKTDVLSVSASAVVEFGIIGKYLQLNGATVAAPLSFAYVLSNPYDTITEATNVGLAQGTNVVYAATGTQASVVALFYDSDLTQLVFGDPLKWYSFRLLSNPAATPSQCNIDESGVVLVD